MEYGFIKEGYLHSKEVAPRQEWYRDENDQLAERTISIEEQLVQMGDKWKPVDTIDESRLQASDEDHIVLLFPYDAGDRIAYEYRQVFDTQKFKNEIEQLKQQLTASDYKISKCYEASLIGEELPYNIQQLHAERQQLRNRINELQEQINS